MVVEATLFNPKQDSFTFDRQLIDQVAFPLGDRYPGEIFSNYWNSYGGVVQRYRPRRCLEIGVRYGYTAAVCCLAAAAAKPPYALSYVGLDDESYHANSCAVAQENLRKVVPLNDARVLKWNSFNGLPPSIGSFDLILIDGNHDRHGVLNDLGHCWPVLNPGGIILLDDYFMPQIEDAIRVWLDAMDVSDELVEVQWHQSERGHCLIRKSDKQ